MKTLLFARAMAARAAAKYAAPSIRKATRCARSMRQQLRPATSRFGSSLMNRMFHQQTYVTALSSPLRRVAAW
jgi:hypothetical protein